ncbi:DUF3099 domain-containing protein [Microbacterium hominis]|uniref:DUF3099 domain-containing protein n=1 Tax=Microbacterium hominis TaxID=162426 RepID=A0A7D4TGS4_9MICO|nr:DUF3099 domain-containing protein [Microbacterium hominis]QKJ19581.1 DUF3099 domain-containing protein [Microbacterium hominis]
MKSSHHAQSATSLPRSPRDEAGARSRRYLIMMGVRIVCFVLMVLITPYGWYTWVLGAAAIFLPYIAVVSANVGDNVRSVGPENPERALPAAADAAPDEAHVGGADDRVIRIDETRPHETFPDETRPDGDPR